MRGSTIRENVRPLKGSKNFRLTMVSGRVEQTWNKASNRSGMKCLSLNIHVSVDFWMLPDKFLRKIIWSIHSCLFTRASWMPRDLVKQLCFDSPSPPAKHICLTRLLLREETSYPKFAQHSRLKGRTPLYWISESKIQKLKSKERFQKDAVCVRGPTGFVWTEGRLV